MPRSLFTLFILLVAASPRAAGQDPLAGRGADPAALESLFRAGSASPVPPGAYAGRVLWVDDAPLPEARAAECKA